MNNERISLINVEDEMRESYLSYAMSVIASRALPDVRDGLKPVQRRILYAMREMGMTPDKQHRKCAGIVGEVLKTFHPHGDSSVYDALVRMAQDFTLRYPLVDGHGNFGSIDGDPPAAYRYTEARLARIALEMLADIDKETVNFIPNFDNQGSEPVVLPARLPQLLVNGSSGIAVGMATNIPPHNVGEICDAVAALIDADYESTPAEELDDLILGIVQGPDFPTAGIVMGKEAIRQAYKTGRGSVLMRGAAEIVEEKGRFKIVISEVPFQVNKSRIVEAIAEAHAEKRIQGISRLDDESSRKGLRVVVELAKNATPQVVLNQLYKHTPLQSSFGFNMLALVPVQLNPDYSASEVMAPLEPRVLSLREMLIHYIEHRTIVVRRRTEYDLRKAEERAHILEGFRIALDHIDEIITIIRASDTTELARERLIGRFSLSVIQANAILDMRLRTLTGLERQKIEDEYSELIKLIAELKDILASKRRITGLVKSELLELKKRFGDPRRTRIEAVEGEDFAIEDMIPDTEVVVTATVGGYIKRVSVDTFRAQNRGGRGVIGIGNLKREDVVSNMFSATTHQHILFFTNKGRAYRLRAYEIPDSTRQARGTALVNLLTLPPGENVTAIFPISNFEGDKYLVMVTRRGVIKKTRLGEFANVRRNGLNAIDLDENDELLSVDLSDGTRDVILATREGMAVHFNETDVRPMGRNARGVRAITVAEGDSVVAMDIVEDERREVMIVTSQAFGKRTPIDEYRHTSRGGKGVKAFAKEKDIGYVIDQILVKQDDEILIMTSANQIIRIRVADIRKSGRSTKGVRLQRLDEGDEVIAITNLGAQSSQIEDITGEAAGPPATSS
ncbi:MAG TPA: DNA gyrase subunit A [Candidatus Acidoferrales bacterium]|nr:DNA gyrase subunit A [Candidatus Acidoferrales bacterium]